MRERLAAAFALVAILVVGVFALSRAYAVDHAVTARETAEVASASGWLAVAAEQRLAAGSPVDRAFLRPLVGPGERLEYVDAAGVRTTVTGSDYSTADPGNDLARTRTLPGGGSVTVRRAGADVQAEVARTLLPLVLVGMAIALGAAGLGFLIARRLARPFRELAEHALSLGRGRFDIEVTRYGIPEADTIGRALETSAEQLRELLRRERRFATEASHELRTPITALRLELEDLTFDPALPGGVAAQVHRGLAEVDRLSNTVGQLLERTRGGRLGVGQEVDVTSLAADAVRRWERHLRPGRVIVADAPGPALVRLPPGPIDQVLDALLEDALLVGEGRVTLMVRDAEDHVHLRVSDEAPADGSRAGALSIADTVEALGATLVLEPGPGTSLAVRLPRA